MMGTIDTNDNSEAYKAPGHDKVMDAYIIGIVKSIPTKRLIVSKMAR
jgi:hypothetical protein